MLINTSHFNMSSTIGCMNLVNANRIITTKISNSLFPRHAGTSGERLITFLRLTEQIPSTESYNYCVTSNK